jgi:hypothetical protein
MRFKCAGSRDSVKRSNSLCTKCKSASRRRREARWANGNQPLAPCYHLPPRATARSRDNCGLRLTWFCSPASIIRCYCFVIEAENCHNVIAAFQLPSKQSEHHTTLRLPRVIECVQRRSHRTLCRLWALVLHKLFCQEWQCSLCLDSGGLVSSETAIMKQIDLAYGILTKEKPPDRILK